MIVESRQKQILVETMKAAHQTAIKGGKDAISVESCVNPPFQSNWLDRGYLAAVGR